MKLGKVIAQLTALQNDYGKEIDVVMWDCTNKRALPIKNIMENYDICNSATLNIEVWVEIEDHTQEHSAAKEDVIRIGPTIEEFLDKLREL
jgi:RNAse (barnase) inhibitor barstar